MQIKTNKQRYAIASIVLCQLIMAGIACTLPGVADPPPGTLFVTKIVTVTVTKIAIMPSHYASDESPLLTRESEAYKNGDFSTAGIMDSAPWHNGDEGIMPTQIPGAIQYVVVAGDSLYSIAGKLCGDFHQYKRLSAINGIGEGEVLEVGRVVIVECEKGGPNED